MKVLREIQTMYPGDPARIMGFEKFERICADFYLVVGQSEWSALPRYRDKKIVFLEWEEPNRFASGDPTFDHPEYEDYFDKVFTLCPYTADWLNKKFGNDKRTPVFLPFNDQYLPPAQEKKYDIIFVGRLRGENELWKTIEIMSKFNYRVVSGAKHPLVTNPKVPYEEKLALIGQSKITLVHNLLFFTRSRIKNLMKTEDWERNEAFRLIRDRNLLGKIFNFHKEYEVPQIKTRTFDAAFCRSLILCRKDSFNVIERFFEPGKEFVYYEPDKLSETISDILKHYDEYKPIIENAYKRAMAEYTTEKFVNKYLRNLYR